MKDKLIRIPAIISLALYGAGLSAALLVTLLQNHLTGLFYISDKMKEHFVVPTVLISQCVSFAVACVFVYLVFKYEGDRRRMIGIIMFAVMIGIGVFFMPVQLVTNSVLIRINGAEYVAKYSSVTTMVSAVTSVFSLGASHLYFVAVGRYGITPKSEM